MGLKTAIYAPRLRGDIDLGLEPSRIDGFGAKAWARMDFPGGRIPGQPDQLITEQKLIPRFRIGTKRVEYGRTFRYSKAGGDITHAANALMVANGNYRPGYGGSHVNEDGFWGPLKTLATLGEKSLVLDEEDQPAAPITPRVKNYYQGAYITIFVAPFNVHYIVASDLGTTTTTKIYLDHGILQTTIPTANDVEIHLSPYSNVVDVGLGDRNKSFVGKPLLNITDGYHFWLQTAGPTWVQPRGWNVILTPGWAADYRDVYAWCDGSIASAAGAAQAPGSQRVGYLLAATEGGEGSVFIMLQLDQ